MISKLKDAASSNALQLKILHDTDEHPAMTLIHQSVGITIRARHSSACLGKMNHYKYWEEREKVKRGAKRSRGGLALFSHLRRHQSRARAIQRSQICRLRRPQSFFKYDCKLVYLRGIYTHWCNHMLTKDTVQKSSAWQWHDIISAPMTLLQSWFFFFFYFTLLCLDYYTTGAR